MHGAPAPALGPSDPRASARPLGVSCPEHEAAEAQLGQAASQLLPLSPSLRPPRWGRRVPPGAQDSVAGALVVLSWTSVPEVG